MKYYFLALGTVVVVCVGCAMDGNQLTNKGEYHAPPADRLVNPGPMVDGPGPGVIPTMAGPGMWGCPPAGPPQAPATTQVRFVGPIGLHIGWLIPTGYAENQLVAPASYNFFQGGTYRLKITNLPGRDVAGQDPVALYPTLQVYPTHPNTEAYLTHNSVPIQLTEEDLEQVESGNFVTKVIYLPDAKYQELAIANVETLVSTRLDPGVDPIQEADKRGTIMAVLRMGNKDLGSAGPVARPMAAAGQDELDQVSYQVDGDKGQLMPPMPIGPAGQAVPGIPGAMMMAGSGMPGQPIAGVNMQAWGMPITGTPIGLPGPTHLPLGRPAGLQSHTIRNRSRDVIPPPTKDMLIDVSHEPGASVPPPVSYIQYKEKHPVYSPGELSNPAWNNGARPY